MELALKLIVLDGLRVPVRDKEPECEGDKLKLCDMELEGERVAETVVVGVGGGVTVPVFVLVLVEEGDGV